APLRKLRRFMCRLPGGLSRGRDGMSHAWRSNPHANAVRSVRAEARPSPGGPGPMRAGVDVDEVGAGIGADAAGASLTRERRELRRRQAVDREIHGLAADVEAVLQIG